MIFDFEERPSDSPLAEVIWRDHTQGEGAFISMATSRWQMVVTRQAGTTTLILRGPETRATPAYCPPDAQHFGVYFTPGALLHNLPAGRLRDGALELPAAGSRSFWLDGSAWEYPTYENVDTFLQRLQRAGLLAHEPAVAAVLRFEPPGLSERSLQRRFLRATGLTRGALAQIDRARQAARLLRQGVSILNTVEQAGYADQPHLTRALKHFTGQTPAQLQRRSSTDQLSFLPGLGEVTPG